MKKLFVFIGVLFLLLACSNNQNYDPQRFKQGVFEIPAGENYGKTRILRKGSLQIEFYENSVDTLIITWKNNFNYDLRMLNPKKPSDEDIIHVQIKKIKASSYTFEAKIGYTNFVQNGELFILDN